MDRRKFIYNSLIGAAVLGTSACKLQSSHPIISDNIFLGNPLAINMWDFSWMTRQYKGGGFEDFTKVLDELQLRGYNALRIDCFPQFIAKKMGEVKETFELKYRSKKPALWGNGVDTTINPRKSLVEFLTLCKTRNIKIVLSSWFLDHGTKITQEFQSHDDFVRAWNETLEFLNQHDLLQNIIYVDLLNEYPLWHGFKWLSDSIDKLGAQKESSKGYDFLSEHGKRFNEAQVNFYNSFITGCINKLREEWPDLKFMTSQTNTLNVPWQDLDVSAFDVLDIHCWFVYNKEFSLTTNYFEDLHAYKDDSNFKMCHEKINTYWKENKVELVNWMDDQIRLRRSIADKFSLPFGNTEGWGAVMWMDHKDLDWNFIKETGIIGAEIGRKYKMKFNCSSNFNHPHFSLWDDVAWHQEVTKIIRDV